jgi:hypothetical protein
MSSYLKKIPLDRIPIPGSLIEGQITSPALLESLVNTKCLTQGTMMGSKYYYVDLQKCQESISDQRVLNALTQDLANYAKKYANIGGRQHRTKRKRRKTRSTKRRYRRKK